MICSNLVASNFDKYVLNYKSNKDLIKKIIFLKNRKIVWDKFSKKSHFFVKKYKWNKVQNQYLKIINL